MYMNMYISTILLLTALSIIAFGSHHHLIQELYYLIISCHNFSKGFVKNNIEITPFWRLCIHSVLTAKAHLRQ